MSEKINHNRRRICGAAAMVFGASQFSAVASAKKQSTTSEQADFTANEEAITTSVGSTEKESAMDRVHQPGQAVFQSVLPEDIDWRPFPSFPPSVRLAVVVGDLSQPAPYVIRVKVPNGVILMPHTHPEDRIYTVMSGVFYIGLGDHFDAASLTPYPPGSVIVLPGNTPHFHWAKSGEYISQITAIGPLGLEYLNPADDPRKS
jgi:quercetin dioxygenase-like cupin family protein